MTILLATSAAAAPSLSYQAWLGHWQAGDQRIDIDAASDGQLAIDGYAVWGTHDPVRIAKGAVHLADFSVVATPQAGQLRFSVSALDGRAMPHDAENALCHLTLHLVAHRLVVDNPDECGGAYVSFTGTYRRRGPPNAEAQGR